MLNNSQYALNERKLFERIKYKIFSYSEVSVMY